MKKVAAVLVATLVLALAAPAFAQPFADVPPDHWAYDAIAELAAKGLVEGYPDGTFKGDRALTRYEMAMVVARILARIEAIVIPPPEVRKADLTALQTQLQGKIATVQRLVNEFRAELAALGVRVTAIEEELNAIKARLDNTRITGDFVYLYDMRRFATFFGGSATGEPVVALARVRLTYTGNIAPGVSHTLRVRYYYFTGSTGVIDVDRNFIDLNNGPLGLQYRIGRQVLTLGPIGILFGQNFLNERRDGIRVQGRFGGITVIAAAFWWSPTQGGAIAYAPPAFPATTLCPAPCTGYTAVARAQMSLFPGWTFGVNFRSDRDPNNSSGGGAIGNMAGWGWSVDFQGNITSSVQLVGEYAQYTWNPLVGLVGQPGNAYKVQANIDLSRISSTLAPTLSVWYRAWNMFGFYGGPLTSTFFAGLGVPLSPMFHDGLWDINGYWTLGDVGLITGGGVAAVGGQLALNLFPNWSADISYELTRFQFFPGHRFHEIYGGVNWAYARNTLIRFEYFNWHWTFPGGGVNLDHYFRFLVLARW